MKPPITHVAIRFQGKVWSLPKPNRHHHVIWYIVKETGVDHVDSYGKDQGFLDSSGKYLSREEALISAKHNGQLREDRPIWNNELYSENLW